MNSFMIRGVLIFCILAFLLVNLGVYIFDTVSKKNVLAGLMVAIVLVNGYLVLTS